MTTSPITTDEVLDSRDILARLDDLTEDRDAHEEGGEAWAKAFPEEAEELAALEALASEAEGSPDWSYGETLIRDDYFASYTEELADDIGLVDRNANWPLNCIDWEEAASQLKVDYFEVKFQGVTYWIRG